MPAEKETRAAPAWLAIVGIGEDGVAGLGDEAKRLIAEAEFVFGGKRHFDLAGSLVTGEMHQWPEPFDPEMEAVLDRAGRRVCVLASGDPFFHGVGVTLARKVAAADMVVVPAPSSFSLAASRLGWALQDIETISLHGRPLDLIRPLLHPGARILALTSDGTAPSKVAALLSELGFGPTRLTVLEALGGSDEVVRSVRAGDFNFKNINPLNVLAFEIESESQARVLPLASGLSDDLFETDGQITKREVRAITLSALAPRRGEVLWDIGAGSGSVAIEWMLTHPSLRAVAIEANAERAERIRRNASSFGVPGLAVVEGEAPKALAGLPSPDVIFIGGGGTDAGVFDAALKALPSGGRCVANAVTLEMEALLVARQAELGGTLTRIAIARAAAVGTMQAWRPALPVTQWSWIKP